MIIHLAWNCKSFRVDTSSRVQTSVEHVQNMIARLVLIVDIRCTDTMLLQQWFTPISLSPDQCTAFLVMVSPYLLDLLNTCRKCHLDSLDTLRITMVAVFIELDIFKIESTVKHERQRIILINFYL